MLESEDKDAGPSKKSSPPPAKKAKCDLNDEEMELEARMQKDPEATKVRSWRHKLQKSFLSSKSTLKEEDMPALDNLLTAVEKYEQMNRDYLSFSKIRKVMRHIAALPVKKIPRDDEFKFRERAEVLVDKWHQILCANKPNGMDMAVNGDAAGGAYEAITQATAAIDLNGKREEGPVEPGAEGHPGDNGHGRTKLILVFLLHFVLSFLLVPQPNSIIP